MNNNAGNGYKYGLRNQLFGTSIMTVNVMEFLSSS